MHQASSRCGLVRLARRADELPSRCSPTWFRTPAVPATFKQRSHAEQSSSQSWATERAIFRSGRRSPSQAEVPGTRAQKQGEPLPAPQVARVSRIWGIESATGWKWIRAYWAFLCLFPRSRGVWALARIANASPGARSGHWGLSHCMCGSKHCAKHTLQTAETGHEQGPLPFGRWRQREPAGKSPTNKQFLPKGPRAISVTTLSCESGQKTYHAGTYGFLAGTGAAFDSLLGNMRISRVAAMLTLPQSCCLKLS